MAEGKIQHCSSMAPTWDPEAGVDPGDSAPVEILESRGCSPLLSALLRLWLETSDLFLMCGMLSHFSRVQLFVTSWTIACQAPLPMGFFRQEYWSGLPSLLQGIFPTQGLNPDLLHCRKILYCLSYQGSSIPHYLPESIYNSSSDSLHTI